jgi:hypothetical protein
MPTQTYEQWAAEVIKQLGDPALGGLSGFLHLQYDEKCTPRDTARILHREETLGRAAPATQA